MRTGKPAAAIKRPGYMFCWLSGMTPSVRPENWHGGWGLELAHIASGAGRATRTDSAKAVVLLCSLAHRLHVSDADRLPTMHIAGREWPTIDERHTIWIKQKIDVENFDHAYLRSIWIGEPAEPEPPPKYWRDMFFNNTGMML